MGNLLQRQPAFARLGWLGTDFPGEVGDGLLEIRIVAGERQRRAVLRERLLEVAAPMMDFRDAANGGEILGRALQHELQLGLRLVQLVELDERAAERDARGEITGMNGEAGAGHRDRLFVCAGAAALLGELREGDRRRVFLNPASKVFNPRKIGHGYGTVTRFEKTPVRPRLSVTVSVTVNEPAAGNACEVVGDADGPAKAPSPKDH